MRIAIAWCIAMSSIGMASCTNDAPPSGESSEKDSKAPAPTNRIAVPAAVRQNLDITCAKVERRPVQKTIRLPGQFELRPEARREFHAMAPGRVELHVTQFQSVEPDTLLATLDSPEWRRLQHEAVEAEGDIKVAQAELDVAIAHKVEAEKAAELLAERIKSLQEVQIRKVELEAQLAELNNSLPRLDAEIQSKRVGLDESNEHYLSLLNTLASPSGLGVEALLEMQPVRGGSAMARWRQMNKLEIRAEITGVVDTLDVTHGGWVDAGGLVMTVVDPAGIRFRANALQSDMAVVRSGQGASIVPPQGGSIAMQDAIEATLLVGFRGSADERTIPLYAMPKALTAWAKPGVSAFLEVFTAGVDSAELAIPVSAVVQDGLASVYFRRNPSNPDEVIRIEGDLGASDGRWVVVNSGLKAGDEVVLDGAYQLMLASSGSAAKGGHFHADGTFHEGDD